MPEYLSPGVYVEEIPSRKFIEGVSTSTCGIVGQTGFGPTNGRPDVVTSYADFQNRYGGWNDLQYAKATNPGQINYTAHAARQFFDNGGQRLYVARVFAQETGTPDTGMNADGVARLAVTPSTVASVQARYPGSWGNQLRLNLLVMRKGTANLIVDAGGSTTIRGVYEGALVQTFASAPTPPNDDPTRFAAPGPTDTYYVRYVNGVATLFRANDNTAYSGTPGAVYLLELQLQVFVGSNRLPSSVYSNLGLHPAARNYIGKLLDPDQPSDPDAQIAVIVPSTSTDAGALLTALVGATSASPTGVTMSGGNDGAPPGESDYAGDDTDELHPTGLYALGHVDEIAIVMAPDAAAPPAPGAGTTRHAAINAALIDHCESLRYRFAILDEPKAVDSGAALAFRSMFDSDRAAIYYPWVKVADPRPGQDGNLLTLPPSGFLAGIYARTDVNRGVWKSPANEPVLNALDFEFHIHKGVQDVLNPRDVNCLRFFEEGGFRVWGARTLGSDPEWRYISVRRLFIYLEHSIDKGTQWVVFEPNNERTWNNVAHTVSDFLLGVWKQGALMGTKPEEAFFVKCDRTTMTQNDLDNGRLVCVIGVAPAYPAEFVIFRIGQFTADSQSL